MKAATNYNRPKRFRATDSIGVRTAWFSWLVTILSIAIFAAFVIPFQKNIFLDVLQSKAHIMAASVRDIAVGAVATDDYSEVVDHCLKVVSSDKSVLYFAITRRDGFSLVHTDSAWKVDDLSGMWVSGTDRNAAVGEIKKTELHDFEVYHYIEPINYSGVGWGWIHIGLSLEQYHQSVAAVYKKTVFVALLCIIIGLGVAVIYAKRLVKPLRLLKFAVERVANGELSVHADIHSRDEVESLADSFNDMTAVLRQTHTELVASKEEAETASKSKSQFLANMSHEIRTPLNGVVGMLKLLNQTSLDAKQQRFVKQGILSSEALLTVINDVLDFSKIEAGKLEFEKVRFELLVVVENVIQMFAIKAEEKGLELASLVYRNVPSSLVGDPSRIGQILINLVSNAIKFTDSGDVVLRVFVEDEKGDDIILRFDVTDTGIGISKEEQARIFEPFMQEDNSTTRRFGGTGLGLGISKHLAELMDGSLSVESTPGQGATFSFTIHLKKHQGTGAPTRKALTMKGLRILVVEDHPISREIICYQMDAWGCEYDAAADGETALSMLKESAEAHAPFDLAIIDWKMPGMDGLELGRRIKEDEQIQDTTLIMLSSVNKISAQYYQEAGFASYLTKPAKQSELYDAIVDALNNVVRTEAPVSQIQEAAKRNARLTVKILLAEDNEINQEVAQEILSMSGFKCDVVSSGLEAVNAMKDKHYDIIFMDCMMPDMDGYEATKLIRSFEVGTGSRLPIIALTANAMRGDRERCLAAGMDDYLCKPVDPERMITMVDKWRLRSDEDNENDPFTAPPLETDTDFGAWFDRGALVDRCMGNEGLADKVIEKFITQTSTDLIDAEGAVSVIDTTRLMHTAHRIKGAAANLSMEKVREAAAKLEATARDGDLPEAKRCYKRLQSTFERTRLLVEKMAEKKNRAR